jgi:REP element-mobilizing transposase RayT
LPSLRNEAEREVIELAFSRGSDRFGFRLVEYSIQPSHLHLVVEAKDRRSLWRGMQGLLVRVARALNKLWGRKGRVFADRYRARSLQTAYGVRTALLHVLHNARHHGRDLVGVDPYSSGPWFDGWTETVARAARPSPCVSARTWLLLIGWRRFGLIWPDELTRAA